MLIADGMLMMKNGQMLFLKNGELITLSEDLTLTDGTLQQIGEGKAVLVH